MFGAAAGLLLAIVLTAFDETPPAVARAGSEGSPPKPAAQTLTDTEPSLSVVGASTAAQPAESSTESPAGSSLAGPPPPPAATAAISGLRLSIPSLAVDAPIVGLGFKDDGQLDVPSDGVSIGWYDISPPPGQPGSALLGGHYDWDGSLAVFWRLGELEAGDRVRLDDGAGSELVYEVQVTLAVDWDRPLSEILAGDDSGSSLTLFTCGGDFDRARGEYAQRTVVWATLVEPSSLASHWSQ